MSHVVCKIDDKHIPLFRVLWVSDVPHFCGAEDCVAEGRYEIKLDADDQSVWASREERDETISAMQAWAKRATGLDDDPEGEWEG